MKEYLKFERREREVLLRSMRKSRSGFDYELAAIIREIHNKDRAWFKRLSYYHRLRVVRRAALFNTSDIDLVTLLVLHPHIRLMGSGKR